MVEKNMTIWRIAEIYAGLHASPTKTELEEATLIEYLEKALADSPYDVNELAKGFFILHKRTQDYLNELEKHPEIQQGIRK